MAKNWIMQGSIGEIGQSDKVTNYIFFEKEKQYNFAKQKEMLFDLKEVELKVLNF